MVGGFSIKAVARYTLLSDVIKSFCFAEWRNDYLGLFFIFF